MSKYECIVYSMIASFNYNPEWEHIQNVSLMKSVDLIWYDSIWFDLHGKIEEFFGKCMAWERL